MPLMFIRGANPLPQYRIRSIQSETQIIDIDECIRYLNRHIRLNRILSFETSLTANTLIANIDIKTVQLHWSVVAEPAFILFVGCYHWLETLLEQCVGFELLDQLAVVGKVWYEERDCKYWLNPEYKDSLTMPRPMKSLPWEIDQRIKINGYQRLVIGTGKKLESV